MPWVAMINNQPCFFFFSGCDCVLFSAPRNSAKCCVLCEFSDLGGKMPGIFKLIQKT